MKYFIDTEFIEGFHKPLFDKRRHFIDLISIGIVCEDGREYYAISKEYCYKNADRWVQENVIIPLYEQTVSGDNRNRFDADNFHKFYGKPNRQIAKEIKFFVNNERVETVGSGTTVSLTEKANRYIHQGHTEPEFYAYYADYDWVVFCSLFGRMIDLPAGFPMYCRDLKQMLDEKALAITQNDFSGQIVKGTGWDLIEGAEISRNIVDIDNYTLDMRIKLLKMHENYPKQENEHSALDDAKWNFELYKFLNR